MIGLRLRLTGSSRPLLTEPAAYRQIEERNEENSEHSGSQHSADNTGPNRDSARRTGTGSNEERYHATDEGERRHDNGAQALFHSFECRLKRGLALRFLLDSKLADQDRVLGGIAVARVVHHVVIAVGAKPPL